MISVPGGKDAMTALQDGAYQRATITAYDVTQSGSPTIASFSNADIIAGSLEVSKSCAPNGHLDLGAAVSDELRVTIKTTPAIAQTLPKAKVSASIAWDYVNSQTQRTATETIYVFTGVITEVKKATASTYSIVALDPMITFDVPYKLSELVTLDEHDQEVPLAYPVSVKNLVKSIVYSKGAPYLNQNVYQSVSPINLNANATISDIPEDQGYTYRQVLSWCAAWMGVNLRIAAGSFQLELWRWDYPSQISSWSDYYDPPYGLDESNCFSRIIDETEESIPGFAIVNGDQVLYGSTASSNGDTGTITMYTNPIITNLYENYYQSFQVYAGNIYDVLRYAFNTHHPGTAKATPRWYLQPGDIVGVTIGSVGEWIVPTTVTHRLNGASKITAAGYDLSTEDAASSLPSFSASQTNAIESEFQRKLEEGTSGNWTYRKWANGVYECWCKKSDNVTFGALGSTYGTGQIYNATNNSAWDIAFPITFASTPCVVTTVNSGVHTNVTLGTVNSAHILPRFWTPILSSDGSTPLTTATINLHIYAVGRWQ